MVEAHSLVLGGQLSEQVICRQISPFSSRTSKWHSHGGLSMGDVRMFSPYRLESKVGKVPGIITVSSLSSSSGLVYKPCSAASAAVIGAQPDKNIEPMNKSPIIFLPIPLFSSRHTYICINICPGQDSNLHGILLPLASEASAYRRFRHLGKEVLF